MARAGVELRSGEAPNELSLVLSPDPTWRRVRVGHETETSSRW